MSFTRATSTVFSAFSCNQYISGYGLCSGTIIPQREINALVTEGLRRLNGWNLVWNPKLFMMDKNPQEQGAVHTVLPTTIRFECDFHQAQANERWLTKASKGVAPTTEDLISSYLKKLASLPWVQLVAKTMEQLGTITINVYITLLDRRRD